MANLRAIEWGFPFTLSRNTDIPRFWMKRFFEWKDRGYIQAPHPQTGLLAQWSLKPEDHHSMIWWSKDYRYFLKNPRIGEIDAYRNFFNMTICGDRTTELGVPELDIQIASFEALVARYGPEKVQWRYSPVPSDWSQFEYIVGRVAATGVKSCYYSFLHSDSIVKETRSVEMRSYITMRLCEILDKYGMTLLGCWDDDQFAVCGASNFGKAVCVDAYLIDKLYGLDKYKLQHIKESGCRCSMSVEVANQTLLPCAHNCSWCYAAPDNIKGYNELTQGSES